MRKFLGFLYIMLIVFGFLVIPASTMALSLSDVGGVDQLIAQTNLGNSGDDTELNWVNSILDGYYVLTSKTDTKKGAGWLNIEGEDAVSTFAYDVSAANTEYFLVKTGNLGTSYRDFLFKNIGDLDWAVINLEGMGFSTNDIENVGKLSHIDTFKDPPPPPLNPVPEPATMLLFGSGLLGIAGLRRKLKR